MNLIQIMGRTAHAWQPYMSQDPFFKGRSVVMRPDLRTVEVNSILLARDAEEPRKTRYWCPLTNYDCMNKQEPISVTRYPGTIRKYLYTTYLNSVL